MLKLRFWSVLKMLVVPALALLSRNLLMKAFSSVDWALGNEQ